jgi:DNA mismatch endonuclease, patch repair protein
MSRRDWRPSPKKEYSPRDSAITSRMMSAVRHKNSEAEILLRRELWRRGFHYRLHDARVLGRPDLVFVGRRVVVFVDSDFWHARPLVEGDEAALRATIRGAKQDWWVEKLRRNALRDRDVTDLLSADGWRVIRVWESAILRDPFRAAARIASVLARRSSSASGTERPAR